MLSPISRVVPELWDATCAEKDRVIEDLEPKTTVATAVMPQFIDLYYHRLVVIMDIYPGIGTVTDFTSSQQTSNLALSARSLGLAVNVLKTLVNPGTAFPLGHHIAALALMVCASILYPGSGTSSSK